MVLNAKGQTPISSGTLSSSYVQLTLHNHITKFCIPTF